MMVYHRILNIVPCVIHKTLLFIYFYIQEFASTNSNSQPFPLCLAYTSLFSVSLFHR